METKLTTNDPVVFHFRLGKGKETQPKAGATVVFLPDQMQFGIALCCCKDRYNKRWGRMIATARARNPKSTRNHRFDSSPDYEGSLEFDEVKHEAHRLAQLATFKVDNPTFRREL